MKEAYISFCKKGILQRSRRRCLTNFSGVKPPDLRYSPSFLLCSLNHVNAKHLSEVVSYLQLPDGYGTTFQHLECGRSPLLPTGSQMHLGIKTIIGYEKGILDSSDCCQCLTTLQEATGTTFTYATRVDYTKN